MPRFVDESKEHEDGGDVVSTNSSMAKCGEGPMTPLFEEREDVEGPTRNPRNEGMT